jgi:hypothetical protein
MRPNERWRLEQQKATQAAIVIGTLGPLLQYKKIDAPHETVDRLQKAWNEYMQLCDLLEHALL